MKAFVLAAGLGTRLKPWTLSHPKALVPVGGVPMLERVIRRLEEEGFDRIVVNVHHFASQITDFLGSRTWKARVDISDETDLLLDTGGALLHAAPLLCEDDEPFLIHNVDILSDAPLAFLMETHIRLGGEATLLVSCRDSSRHLLFDRGMRLRAWENIADGKRRGEPGDWPHSLAFSGIHVMNPSLVRRMAREGMPPVFPVMDYYLSHTRQVPILGEICHGLRLIDIGKPETLSRANSLFAGS